MYTNNHRATQHSTINIIYYNMQTITIYRTNSQLQYNATYRQSHRTQHNRQASVCNITYRQLSSSNTTYRQSSPYNTTYKYKHHTTQHTDNHHKIQHSDNHHRTQVQHADKFTIIIKYNIQTIFIQRKDNHHHTTQQIANHHTSQCKDNHQKLNMGPITIH